MAVKELDLRGTPCPINFVRIKIALDDAEPGTVVEAIIDDGEAYESVPKSVQEEGHNILSLKSQEDNSWKIVIERG
ncbi:MAG: sulfurtransferase TusA family protein [Candidatus Caenarcaniphilales bacterium]|nr:sulfurtransferase TusA family protein [Candidatus Caenarcaniphilales bacterium]